MFKGQAEEAMHFYVALFDNSEIIDITRYKKGEAVETLVKEAEEAETARGASNKTEN